MQSDCDLAEPEILEWPEPVLIDLDAPGAPGTDDAADSGHRKGPPTSGRRSTIAAAVALVALASLAGAAPSPSTTVRHLATIKGSRSAALTVGDRTVYLTDPSGQTRAFDAASGQRRWTLPGGQPSEGTAREIGSVVLQSSGFNTVAREAATGRLRWRHPGALIWTLPDLSGVVLENETGSGSDRQTLSLTARSITDGDQLWEYRCENSIAEVRVVYRERAADTEDIGLIILSATGPQRFLDFRSGRAVALPDLPGLTGMTAIDDLYVFGTRPGAAGGGASGYDRSSLAPRWRNPLLDLPSTVYPARCGSWRCLSIGLDSLDTPPTVAAIDPATGTVRWSRSGVMVLGGLDSRVFAFRYASGRQDSMTPGTQNATVQVLSSDTGKTLLSLRGWEPVAINEDHTRMPVRQSDAAGRGQIAVLDLRDLTLTPLTRLSGPGFSCTANNQLVACTRADGRVEVWRYSWHSSWAS